MASIRSLPALIRKQFRIAHESQDLTFYATRVSIVQCEGLPVCVAAPAAPAFPQHLIIIPQFQLRFSPALADKPQSNKNPNSNAIDPFENPSAALFITDLPPSHVLVLNKFPVIPEHFILATKAFKKQTDPLEADDLAAAYACLRAYREEGEELFGFFNSGEHSGASQLHRHIQFLPVESMRSGLQNGEDWNVIADSLLKTPGPGMRPIYIEWSLSPLTFAELPFTYFSSAIPENPSPEHLHEIYVSLLQKACDVSRELTKSDEQVSYNLGLTDKAMVLCPRTSEGLTIKNSSGELMGPVALNGTVLGGTLLVKSEGEWDALRSDEAKLHEILSAIGIPPTKSEREGKLQLDLRFEPPSEF